MTNAQPPGVVVDTMVISWLFDRRPNPLADRYRALVGPKPELRRRRLERRIAEITVIQPDDKMITASANLRVR